VRPEEAGALHDLGLDECGRDDGDEARRAGLLHREVHQRQLELRPDAGEEVEARAADLGAALGVDGPEFCADLGVVARLLDRRDGADGLEDHEVVLPAGRDAVLDDVRDGEVRGAQGGIGLRLVGFGGLDLVGQMLCPAQQGRSVLRRRPGDLPAERLLLPRRSSARATAARRASAAASRASTRDSSAPGRVARRVPGRGRRAGA